MPPSCQTCSPKIVSRNAAPSHLHRPLARSFPTGGYPTGQPHRRAGHTHPSGALTQEAVHSLLPLPLPLPLCCFFGPSILYITLTFSPRLPSPSARHPASAPSLADRPERGRVPHSSHHRQAADTAQRRLCGVGDGRGGECDAAGGTAATGSSITWAWGCSACGVKKCMNTPPMADGTRDGTPGGLKPCASRSPVALPNCLRALPHGF